MKCFEKTKRKLLIVSITVYLCVVKFYTGAVQKSKSQIHFRENRNRFKKIMQKVSTEKTDACSGVENSTKLQNRQLAKYLKKEHIKWPKLKRISWVFSEALKNSDTVWGYAICLVEKTFKVVSEMHIKTENWLVRKYSENCRIFHFLGQKFMKN